MGMKRQELTLRSNRHVSPHVLSADCCGDYANAAATLPSPSVASRGDNMQKYFQEHHFHRKFFGKKKMKSDQF